MTKWRLDVRRSIAIEIENWTLNIWRSFDSRHLRSSALLGIIDQLSYPIEQIRLDVVDETPCAIQHMVECLLLHFGFHFVFEGEQLAFLPEIFVLQLFGSERRWCRWRWTGECRCRTRIFRLIINIGLWGSLQRFLQSAERLTVVIYRIGMIMIQSNYLESTLGKWMNCAHTCLCWIRTTTSQWSPRWRRWCRLGWPPVVCPFAVASTQPMWRCATGRSHYAPRWCDGWSKCPRPVSNLRPHCWVSPPFRIWIAVEKLNKKKNKAKLVMLVLANKLHWTRISC